MKAFWIFLTVLVLAVAGCFMYATYRTAESGDKIVDELSKTGNKLLDGIKDIFTGSQVKKIDRTTYEIFIGSTELVAGSQELAHEALYETTWLGSKKTVKINVKAKVKYGYKFDNLKHLGRVLFNTETNESILELPKPCIISIEPVPNTFEYETSDGLWNQIQDEDLSAAQNQCLAELRASIEREGKYIRWADEEMVKKVEEMYEKNGFEGKSKIEINRLQ